MFRGAPKLKSWKFDPKLSVLFLWMAVAATGCGQSEEFRVDSGEQAAIVAVSDEGHGPDLTVPVDLQMTTAPPTSSADTESREPATKPMRLFLGDQWVSQTDEGQLDFTDAELHKNLTLLFLTLEPDIRARSILQFLREQLTEQQAAQSLAIALAEDHRFLALRQRRAEILETAFDGQNVEQEIRKINVETLATSRSIRAYIFNNVLTQIQRDSIAAQKKLVADAKETKRQRVAIEVADERRDHLGNSLQ